MGAPKQYNLGVTNWLTFLFVNKSPPFWRAFILLNFLSEIF
jgi:hypothetical protein